MDFYTLSEVAAQVVAPLSNSAFSADAQRETARVATEFGSATETGLLAVTNFQISRVLSFTSKKSRIDTTNDNVHFKKHFDKVKTTS